MTVTVRFLLRPRLDHASAGRPALPLRLFTERPPRCTSLYRSASMGETFPAILAGLVGTAIAAWIATALDVTLLHRCFGGFLIVVGLRELFSKG